MSGCSGGRFKLVRQNVGRFGAPLRQLHHPNMLTYSSAQDWARDVCWGPSCNSCQTHLTFDKVRYYHLNNSHVAEERVSDTA